MRAAASPGGPQISSRVKLAVARRWIAPPACRPGGDRRASVRAAVRRNRKRMAAAAAQLHPQQSVAGMGLLATVGQQPPQLRHRLDQAAGQGADLQVGGKIGQPVPPRLGIGAGDGGRRRYARLAPFLGLVLRPSTRPRRGSPRSRRTAGSSRPRAPARTPDRPGAAARIATRRRPARSGCGPARPAVARPWRGRGCRRPPGPRFPAAGGP